VLEAIPRRKAQRPPLEGEEAHWQRSALCDIGVEEV